MPLLNSRFRPYYSSNYFLISYFSLLFLFHIATVSLTFVQMKVTCALIASRYSWVVSDLLRILSCDQSVSNVIVVLPKA